MTRDDAGRRHKWWRADEVGYVLEHAGRVPAREICRTLKVSHKQLEGLAYRIRSQGGNITLRHYSPAMEICPSCGCMRSSLGRHGVCEPCRLEARLREVQAQTAELLSLLPEAVRATYELTDAKLESSAEPMPKAPNTEGMDYYHASKAEEAHDRAMEQWQTRRLNRLVKAAQRRKERITKKL